jgi:mannitol/fructose-specific phosphotransferase system IIA component (Ntr-type)
LDTDVIETITWSREQVAATGIGNGIALPHARIAGLKESVVAIGLSEAGVEFDAPDGQPAHALFFLVTPHEDPEVQLELSANISQMFRDPRALERILRAANYTEFVAAIKILEPKDR